MTKGTGVSEGIGIAKVMIWQAAISHDYVPRKSGNPDTEIARFEIALTSILENNKLLRQKTARQHGDSEATIFDAYSLILTDEEAVLQPTRDHIRLRGLSAEYAVTFQFGELARKFLEMNNEYLRQRAEDVFHLRDQLLRELMGMPATEVTHFDRPTIVVANAISPTDIAKLDLSRLEGIVSETGGYSSHMAIIARTLGVPAVVAVGDILERIHDGDVMALDGRTGEVWLNPDEDEIAMLQERAEQHAVRNREAQSFRGQPTISMDGCRVELSANVSQLEELDAAIAADAEAIGVFRTELLHVAHPPLPTEEEQFKVYRTLIEKMGGKAATVRTFDDGGNRPTIAIKGRQEDNPVLGYRGIRMSLGRPSFFRTQLRALLRASAYGSLRILFPMVSSLDELTEALSAIDTVKNELRREDIPFDEQIPVGILISIPSAALLGEVLAGKVDFFCIHINDLIQFTLAIDRSNPDLAFLYHPYHPSVLRLIKWTVDAAHHHGIPCVLSGEVTDHELVLPLLFGLGLDGFSINPGLILSCRRILNNSNYVDCKRLAEETLQLNSGSEVARRLAQYHTG